MERLSRIGLTADPIDTKSLSPGVPSAPKNVAGDAPPLPLAFGGLALAARAMPGRGCKHPLQLQP